MDDWVEGGRGMVKIEDKDVQRCKEVQLFKVEVGLITELITND